MQCYNMYVMLLLQALHSKALTSQDQNYIIVINLTFLRNLSSHH